MIIGNSRVTSLSVATVPYVLFVCGSVVLLELICHAFLQTKFDYFGSKHLVVEVPIIVFVVFFVSVLLVRKCQSAKEKGVVEWSAAKDDWGKTFNTMSDFVSVHDKDFKIVRVNQSLCDFMGKNEDEIVGKYCYQVFHNTNAPIANCPHQKTSGTGHSETEIISDLNIGFPLHVTCSPLFDTDETFQGSVHIARPYEPAGNWNSKKLEIIPICASCKSIRRHDNKWISPEEYFMKKYRYRFTHSICGGCQEILYPEFKHLTF